MYNNKNIFTNTYYYGITGIISDEHSKKILYKK